MTVMGELHCFESLVVHILQRKAKSTYPYCMKNLHDHEDNKMQISQLAKIMKFARCENSQYTHYSGIQLYTNIAFRRPYDKYFRRGQFTRN